MRKEGESRADGGPQFLSVDIEGFDKQRGGGASRHDPGVRRVAAVRQTDDKGAAAEIAHAFRIAIRLFQPCGYFLDQAIADVAAERIVDGAEFLHVKHQHGAAGISRAHPCSRVCASR